MRAYDVADELRDEFGIEVSKLGCVMLNVSPMDTSFLNRDWEYVSKHPDRRWISGFTPEGETHVTLLYGLLRNANTIKPLVDRVLEGWEPDSVTLRGFKLFDSPFPDEPYKCLVADVLSDNLVEAHKRLSLIPHINTFPDYNAHVTIGYVKEKRANDALKECWLNFGISAIDPRRPKMEPSGLDYGYTDEPSAWRKA